MLSSIVARATSKSDLHPAFDRALARIQEAHRRDTRVEWRIIEVTSSLTVEVQPFLGGELYDCIPASMVGEFFAAVQSTYPVACYHHKETNLVTLLFLGCLDDA